jgi:hypothetical protein
MEPTLDEAIERLTAWWHTQSWVEVVGTEVLIDGYPYDITAMAMAALDIPEPPK